MKYAFIALIAGYLLVYGCGPDNSKKTEDKKGQVVQSTVEKPLQPPPAAELQETAKQPVTAAVETLQPAQQVAATPPSQPATEVKQQAPVADTQKTVDQTTERLQPPCIMAEQQQGAVELTQPDDNNIVVMPCGRMFIKHPVPANAPCLKQQMPPCPMIDERQPSIIEELVMMPCGRVFVRQSMPTDDADLEMLQQTETPGRVDLRPQIIEEDEEDLSKAVQKMVETTNDMVLVTKQLVNATQEMLRATQGTIAEASKTNKESMPAAATGSKKKSAASEREVIDAMQDAVIATQKAIEAMNQAAPKALDPKQ